MKLFTFRLKSVSKVILSVLFISMLLTNPHAVSSAAKEGFNLSLYLVLPSLFPFAVISAFICSNITLPQIITSAFSKLTGLKEQAAAPFLMGLISGYPVGAILISDAFSKKILSKEECEHLLPFSNAAGPLFLIGVAGVGMFGSASIGYYLYFIHLTSVILMLIIFRHFAPRKSRCCPDNGIKLSLVRSIDKAMNSMINVIGCIVFFSVVCRMLSLTGIFEGFSQFSALPYGILELTNGLNRLALCDLPLRLKLSLASFLCGFSGICILLQVQNAVSQTGIPCKKYLLCKLLIGSVAFIMTWVLYPLLPVTIPTFANNFPISPDFVSGGYGFILILLPVYKFIRHRAPFFDKR